jgi:hypothetical protein
MRIGKSSKTPTMKTTQAQEAAVLALMMMGASERIDNIRPVL